MPGFLAVRRRRSAVGSAEPPTPSPTLAGTPQSSLASQGRRASPICLRVGAANDPLSKCFQIILTSDDACRHLVWPGCLSRFGVLSGSRWRLWRAPIPTPPGEAEDSLHRSARGGNPHFPNRSPIWHSSPWGGNHAAVPPSPDSERIPLRTAAASAGGCVPEPETHSCPASSHSIDPSRGTGMPPRSTAWRDASAQPSCPTDTPYWWEEIR